jgi:flavin reductase
VDTRRNPSPGADGHADAVTLPDARALRTVLSTFATGVTVITIGGDEPHGMTANAFTSVSLHPPLVLVCVRHDARMHEALLRAPEFAVSVLASDQVAVARYFSRADRPLGAGQFASVAVSAGERTDVPLIDGALAWLECTRWRVYDGGDHSIVLGRLVSAVRRSHGAPLVFHDGDFRQLTQGVWDDDRR